MMPLKTRSLIVLLAALFLGVVAFGVMQHQRHEAVMHMAAPPGALTVDDLPGLDWLKSELSLTPEQFEKITALHAAYRPHCMEMCCRIMEARDQVDRLSREAKGMTPELEAAIREHAQTRADCQAAMAHHLFETAAAMDERQSARYLEMMLPSALDCEAAPAHEATASSH